MPDYLPLIPLFLLLGAFAGMVAGLLGIGGGMVVVPSLAVLFARHMDPGAPVMHMAVATSLASIALTGSASAWAHHGRRAVAWRQVLLLGPGLIVGALVGAGLSGSLPDLWLGRLFGVFALLVGGKLLAQPQLHRARSGPGTVSALGAGVVFGALSALLGIGGGSFNVPWLVAFGQRMQTAVGTAAAAGVPLALAGSVGYLAPGWQHFGSLTAGYIVLPALATIVAVSVFTAPLGAKLAHRMPAQRLQRVFGLVLVLIGLSMIVHQA